MIGAHAEDQPPEGDAAVAYAEHERIRAVYRSYDTSDAVQRRRDASNPGARRNADVRWAMLRCILLARNARDGLRVLDVGCGVGQDLARIAREMAHLHPSLHGVDLLADRISRARQLVPQATFHTCGAERLPYPDRHFDVVMSGTVFSSILDRKVAWAVAREMTRVLRSGGVILGYDMRYPNPLNPHVRAIGAREWRKLFPGAWVRLVPLTLLPSVARGLGALTPMAYGLLSAVPVLRSHYLAEIRFTPARETTARTSDGYRRGEIDPVS